MIAPNARVMSMVIATGCDAPFNPVSDVEAPQESQPTSTEASSPRPEQTTPSETSDPVPTAAVARMGEVMDGDTLHVQGESDEGHTIRLEGFDKPENAEGYTAETLPPAVHADGLFPAHRIRNVNDAGGTPRQTGGDTRRL